MATKKIDLVTWLTSWFIKISDIVTDSGGWNSTTSDSKVPSEKLVKNSLDAKQDTLVSGTSIKTINNTSLLGSGNITITGGSGLSFDDIYPIGSIYMSVNSTSPATLFGGTWEQIEDKFLLASGTSYSNGSTGGEATHTLTIDEMPSHTHTQNSHNHKQGNSTVVYNASGTQHLYGSGSGTVVSLNTNVGINTNSETATNQNTGGGLEHNNMPPYLVVNVWKRIA